MVIVFPSAVLTQLLMTPRSSDPTFDKNLEINPSSTPETYGLKYEVVRFVTSDHVRINAWYVDGGSSKSVIAVHGGNSDKRRLLPMINGFHKAGFNSLLIDSRNHGQSDAGSTGLTLGIHESKDIVAAAEWLSSDKQSTSIGVVGFSQGSSAALLAAGRSPLIGALVLQGTGYDISELLKRVFPFIHGFVTDNAARIFLFRCGLNFSDAWKLEYPQIKVVEDLSIPAFFISGSVDEIVGSDDVAKLFDVKSGVKRMWVVEGGGHSVDFDQVADEFDRQVNGFLEVSL